MPIRRSPNSVVTPLHTFHSPGHNRPERAVTLPRNRRSPSIGIAGHHAPVRASGGEEQRCVELLADFECVLAAELGDAKTSVHAGMMAGNGLALDSASP